jgi:creatinine amidohydrolase
MMYFIRPDLVDLASIKKESGADQARLSQMKYGYTGIWWYAQFPNHFASDVAEPDKKLGELLIEKDGKQLAELVKYLKNNNTIEKLQEEFAARAADPLKKQ